MYTWINFLNICLYNIILGNKRDIPSVAERDCRPIQNQHWCSYRFRPGPPQHSDVSPVEYCCAHFVFIIWRRCTTGRLTLSAIEFNSTITCPCPAYTPYYYYKSIRTRLRGLHLKLQPLLYAQGENNCTHIRVNINK